MTGLDPKRVAEVAVSGPPGTTDGRASGYRITTATVLTSEHAVRGRTAIEVRFDAGQASAWSTPASVAWADAAEDGALLTLELPPGTASIATVTYGYLGDRPAIVDAQAVGFPWWKLRADLSHGGKSPSFYRDMHQAICTVSSVSNRPSHTLELTTSPPDRRRDENRSPWEGMSGAAVWIGNRIVGIVREHALAEGPNHLTATRIERLIGAMPPEIRRAIGVENPDVEVIDVLDALLLPSSPVYASSDRLRNNLAGTLGKMVPGLLPRDVPRFTGREEELARLTRLVDGGRVVVTTISGTAGVGKTALAIHAAHQLLDQFPDGHLYADLRGYTTGQAPAEPGGVLEVFLRRLGVSAEEVPDGIEERSGFLRQLLVSRRVLMVLDNARTEAQIRPLLPGAGRSLVLVTSRSALPGLEADGRISLDVLTEDEAVAMLAALIGAEREAAEPKEVARLASLCGRLPLALRITGQLLAAHPAWPVARLAGMLVDEQGRLTRLGAGDLQVRAAFEVSYTQLPEADARLFRLLGLHPGPDFDIAAAAALAGTGDQEAGPILDRLAEAHLVTENASGRYGIHDLLRLFARATCQQADDQGSREVAEAGLVNHYADLATLVNSCVDPQLRPAAEQAGTSLPPVGEALAIFEGERPSLLAALSLAAQRGWDEQVLRLSRDVGYSLTLLRYLDDLLTARKAALAAARRTGNGSAEGNALTNLGMAYRDLRRFDEAIDCYQQAIAIYQETGDRHREGIALNNLGNAHYGLRRFKQAMDCLQQAIAIYRETGDRHREGIALTSLGAAYCELRRFEEAMDCLQQSITIYRETGDRRSESMALGNLGVVYKELRRFEEAIDCLQQSITIDRETGDRHGEGGTLNNLGLAYLELQRFQDAIDCYQQDITICQETGDRYGEGMALGNLGVVYKELRRFEEAIDCLQQSITIKRETGDRHGEGETLNNLGLAYLELQRFQDAIDCYQQDITICQETGDRYGEGITLSNLGNAYRALRQYDRAAACWREAAAALHDAGDHEQARHLEKQAASSRQDRRWGLRRRWPP
jgi:tetratricopeptide (TPR) repeat protein